MTAGGTGGPRPRPWWPTVVVVLVAATVFTDTGRSMVSRFLGSLRIAKPASVSVSVSAVAGPGMGRPLLGVVVEMFGDSSQAARGDSERTAVNAKDAAREVGFIPRLLTARRDAPRFSLTTPRDIRVRIDRERLATLLAEAGERGELGLVDGAAASVSAKAGVRMQYGHCPLPVPGTIQGQLQGSLPPSPENADCVLLVEAPRPSVLGPAALPLGQLIGIALELSGLSPSQAELFRRQVDDSSALSVALPRFVRSCDSVRVGEARGTLLNTAGRRGPTYALVWAEQGVVYTLLGYGSAADALPLANSLR